MAAAAEEELRQVVVTPTTIGARGHRAAASAPQAGTKGRAHDKSVTKTVGSTQAERGTPDRELHLPVGSLAQMFAAAGAVPGADTGFEGDQDESGRDSVLSGLSSTWSDRSRAGSEVGRPEFDALPSPGADTDPVLKTAMLDAEIRGVESSEFLRFTERVVAAHGRPFDLMQRREDDDSVSVRSSRGHVLADFARSGGLIVGGKVISDDLKTEDSLRVGLPHLLGLDRAATTWFFPFAQNHFNQGLEVVLASLFPFDAMVMDAGVPGLNSGMPGEKFRASRKRFIMIDKEDDKIIYRIWSWRFGHLAFDPTGELNSMGDPEAQPVFWPIGLYQEVHAPLDAADDGATIERVGFLGPDGDLLQNYCKAVANSARPKETVIEISRLLIQAAQRRSRAVVAADPVFSRAMAHYDDPERRVAIARAFPGVLDTLLRDTKLLHYAGLPLLCRRLPLQKIKPLLDLISQFRTTSTADPLFRKETRIASVLFAAAGFTEDGLTQVADALIELFGSRARRFGAVLDNLYSQGSGMGASPLAKKLYNNFPRVQVSGRYLFFGSSMEKPPAFAEFLARLSGAAGEPSLGPAP